MVYNLLMGKSFISPNCVVGKFNPKRMMYLDNTKDSYILLYWSKICKILSSINIFALCGYYHNAVDWLKKVEHQIFMALLNLMTISIFVKSLPSCQYLVWNRPQWEQSLITCRSWLITFNHKNGSYLFQCHAPISHTSWVCSLIEFFCMYVYLAGEVILDTSIRQVPKDRLVCMQSQQSRPNCMALLTVSKELALTEAGNSVLTQAYFTG